MYKQKRTLSACQTLFLVTLIAAAASITHGSPAMGDMNLGDWLARELGMDKGPIPGASNDSKNGNAIPSQTTGAQSDKAATNAPQQRDRTSFLAKMENKNFAGALEEIDATIDKVLAMGVDENDQIQVSFLASLRFDRAYALKNLNRFVEALIEFHKIKQAISKRDNRLPLLRDLASILLKAMSEQTFGAYRWLQMEPSGNLKTAYRKMMLLLHPDKNTNLNEESRNYMKYLYDNVRNAYESLLKSR